MIILLDTSTPICKLGIRRSDTTVWHEWEASRELAKGLLKYITVTIAQYDAQISDVTGIGVFQGPGSFTGLRIGITVANTVADGLHIPIIGAQGEKWAQDAIDKIAAGKNDRIVLPNYGADAHITKPRK